MDSKPITLDQAAQWLESSADAALITDPLGVIRYVNPAFESLSGYARDDALGRTPAILKSGYQSEQFYRRLWQTLDAGGEFRSVFVNRRRDGSTFHEEKTIRPMPDADGRVAFFVSTGRDISDRVATLERLAHEATHDPLTGLPNRTLFEERLERTLAQAVRTGERFMVALVDVDRFKAVNDLHGHAAGDAALKAVATRLLRILRRSDTAARVGGDEFALLLHDVRDAHRVLVDIVAACRTPVALGDESLSISVGASRYPDAGRDAAALLHHADEAMYKVKRDGGDGFDSGPGRQSRAPAAPGKASFLAAIPNDHPRVATLMGSVPAKRRVLSAGEILYGAGDRFRDVHFLQTGACKLVNRTPAGRERIGAMLFAGDWLGFDGLADGRHACDAVSIDAGQAWTIAYDTLLSCASRELLSTLHAAMARQAARTRHGPLGQRNASVEARVADFICCWADGLEAHGLRGGEIALPVTGADIGSHLGFQPESVSEAMTSLERERLIRVASASGSQVIVPDVRALHEHVRRLAD